VNAPIYLDYAATTPVAPEVARAMSEVLGAEADFGNPSSVTHAFGRRAQARVATARAQVAALIGASPEDIVFTSGATESNNLALLGVARASSGKTRHIVTSKIEHKAVLDPCRQLEREGFAVTYVAPDSSGRVPPESIRAALRADTVLVSVMHANNEIGVIQDIAAIGALCRERGIAFHVDAAQSVGKIPIDLRELPVDLLSFTAHKIYGPKGIGALYVRRRPRVRLVAQINGGGQERGMRSGTLAPPLCVGLGEACAIAKKEMPAEAERLRALRDRFYDALKARLPEIYLNGDLEQRIPGNLNISFAFVEGESLMMGIKGLSVSSGSACTSASLEPSYVLRALGVNEEMAHTSLRIGFGRFTTEEEVDMAVDEIVAHVSKLREMSPLWEMHQEGVDLKSVTWAAH
jgi:cysteine desulfurase